MIASMHDILPLVDIQAKFPTPLDVQQLGLADFSRIASLEPGDFSGLALNVWNRIVHSGRRVDPMALSRFISPDKDYGFRLSTDAVAEIEAIVGDSLIRDISYSHCTFQGKTVAKLLIAHVFPNDLHISDINLQDPRIAIPKAKRKYQYLYFAGLGLLTTVMSRVEEFANQIKVDFITLAAADDYLVKRFGKFGFAFERNKMGRLQRCMEKRVVNGPVILSGLPTPNTSPIPTL